MDRFNPAFGFGGDAHWAWRAMFSSRLLVIEIERQSGNAIPLAADPWVFPTMHVDWWRIRLVARWDAFPIRFLNSKNIQ